jgi:hypothetical protein
MSSSQEQALIIGLVQLIEAKNVVEVGVAWGAMSAAICRAMHQANNERNNTLLDTMQYVGFDIWGSHGPKGISQMGSINDAVSVVKQWGIPYEFIQIDTQNEQDRFRTLLDKRFPNGIDFAFIDGDHSYHGIANDFFNIWPRMTPTGIVAFHDTKVIDGCREFILDLRKNNNGSYDIFDIPYGLRDRRNGVTVISKRTFILPDALIDESCGSLHTYDKIERMETEHYEQNLSELSEWWIKNHDPETRSFPNQVIEQPLQLTVKDLLIPGNPYSRDRGSREVKNGT